LIGTICGYLLAGVAWANCYTTADLLAANAFTMAPQVVSEVTDYHRRAFVFNYFSLCTHPERGSATSHPRIQEW
jgi:hypothetical protein